MPLSSTDDAFMYEYFKTMSKKLPTNVLPAGKVSGAI